MILVALIFVWAAGLALGSALIMHPHLGGGIRGSGGSTPRDFMSALYAAGSSLSFVGSSDFKPQSAVQAILGFADRNGAVRQRLAAEERAER